ncbi:MAG TPA: ABC transporter permease [Gemmatimonadaceae bacterium]|nr:ABC transporter permease [Gemmatimonadaceae bacterium]
MLTRDLRYAARTLLRAPGFAIAVILTLGLGIGANTAIFSVVRGVLLKPLPHRDGSRLLYLRQSVNGPGGDNILFSVPEINDFRTSAKTLGGIAEYSQMTYTLDANNNAANSSGEAAVRVNVGLVTGNYFDVMGLTVSRGRTLTSNDDGTKVPPVMLLTHDFWVSHFGADTGVVGKTVRLDGQPVQIVGIIEPAPYFPNRIDAILNMVISPHHTSAMMVQGRTHRMTEMIARLAPGATLPQARAEVAAIRANVQKDNADSYDPASGYKVTVSQLQEALGQRARPTLWMLMAAAAFVMIISAANVANLTLMRSVRREQEMVIRAALGAGAARLRRLLLAENLVLAAAGAVLGLVIARVGVSLLVTFASRYTTRANEIRLDWIVLGFTLGLTLVVALLLSFAPSIAKEGTLGTWMAAGAARVSGSLRRQRLQRALVVAQIAVSVMLLTGAGLLTRTVLRLSEVDAGLHADNVLTMEVPLGQQRNDTAVKALYDRMRLEVAAIPGVTNVGLGSTMPLRTTGFQLDVKAEGHVPAVGEAMPRAEFRTASPDYFRAAGIPLLAGRVFQETDTRGSGRVVVLNKTLADRLFPNRDPIGQRVAWTGDVLRFIPVSGDWRTVVGIVGDTKDGGLDAPPRPVMFLPFAQEVSFGQAGLVIRAGSNPEALSSAATRLVRNVTPHDPIENVLTVPQIRDQSVAPRRLNAQLLFSFSILAVFIAAVGIAGVLAFSVSARTNEIGIRMSLGADSGQVLRMVLSEGGVLLVIGLLLGVGGSIAASRLIQQLLFGVAPNDPATLAGVAAAMTIIGLVACWVPARRAAKIDPAVAMRGK